MIEWSLATHFLLPIGLGLFGFIEPCAIGSHLLLLGTLRDQSRPARNLSLLIFIATRTFAMGVVGLIVAFIGQLFVDAQKAFWILFGVVYLAMGFAYLLGKTDLIMKRITPRLSPDLHNRNAIVLGIVFGLNIPACAAPLILAVAAAASSSDAVTAGFITMALFGLALSAPLLLLVAIPSLNERLSRLLHSGSRRLRLSIGAVLIIVGLWSMWFGLFVDPRL